MDLTNKRVLIYLKNGFKATGVIAEHSQGFIVIDDEVSLKRRLISNDSVSEIQILDEGN